MTLVSERIGQFFHDGHRLEFTEYGGGDRWVVLLHGQLMPRRMHQPLARHLAGAGVHVVTLDLLGHGRSDRPDDPLVYSMTAFGEQVIALLDDLGAEQAVIGGTSLGANVSLEVASLAPHRVRGLIAEMPVLDNALEAGILAFAPLLFLSRFLPLSITGIRLVTRAVPRGVVPFWAGIALDTLDQRPAPDGGGHPRDLLRPDRPVLPAAPAHRGARARGGAPARPDPSRGRRRDARRGAARTAPSSRRAGSSSGGCGPDDWTPSRPTSSPAASRRTRRAAGSS